MRSLISTGALAIVMSFPLFADDPPSAGKGDQLAAQRFELMRSRMEGLKVRSDNPGFPTTFSDKPIFRYSDPARRYVAAAVWKLGAEGRPRALVTTELHRELRGSPKIAYEYLSLTSSKFSVTSTDYGWEPSATTIEFRLIPGAETPDATPARRFLQMRAIAKRFSGEEVVSNEKTSLRLLPQPVDRYTPSTADRSDGGLFLLCYGTNPELALFIESDGQAWKYAAGRLTAANAMTLMIDDKPAWEALPVTHGRNMPYTASDSLVEIPGIAADGTEILEPKP